MAWNLQKVKAFTDSTKEVFMTVRAERDHPWQCPTMTAASGRKERNMGGDRGWVGSEGESPGQSPVSESGQLHLTSG